MENTLIDQLTEDLSGLATFLRTKDPLPPSHVRITASAIVRKWLIDGWINKLSQLTGVTYTFKSHDTSIIVDAVKEYSDIEFYMTGGILMDGMPLTGIYASKTQAPPDGKLRLPLNEMPLTLFTPSQLLKSKRVFFNGQWFNFESIIRFMANKAGGVHFDQKRDAEWQNVLEQAADFFVFGNPDHEEQRRLIEPYNEKHRMLLVLPKEKGHIWNCLDIELLAAAQSMLHIHADGLPVVEFNAS